MVQPCTGCKFLVHARGADVCAADDGPFTTKTDQFSGRVTTVLADPSKSWIRPSLAEMRAEGGKCGPDRKLYADNAWRRFLKRMGFK